MRLAPTIDPPAGCTVVDAEGCYVVPGGVDSHAHIDEFWKPEQNGFENRDSFFSAGTAAACGGLSQQTTTDSHFVRAADLNLQQ